jgi:hypothetical protein
MAEKAGKIIAERDRHAFALREFTYDDETGPLDRGQVVELRGHVNDAKLLNLRYLAPCTPGQELLQCGVCGRLFIDDVARTIHGDRRHAYECECGWRPAYDAPDPARSLAAHRARCDDARAEKQAARTQQRREIAAQPGRQG